jgi:hypothetical protein
MIDCVSDEQILQGWRDLARLEGVFVEPASAAGVAGSGSGAVCAARITEAGLATDGLTDTGKTGTRSGIPILKTASSEIAFNAARRSGLVLYRREIRHSVSPAWTWWMVKAGVRGTSAVAIGAAAGTRMGRPICSGASDEMRLRAARRSAVVPNRRDRLHSVSPGRTR